MIRLYSGFKDRRGGGEGFYGNGEELKKLIDSSGNYILPNRSSYFHILPLSFAQAMPKYS